MTGYATCDCEGEPFPPYPLAMRQAILAGPNFPSPPYRLPGWNCTSCGTLLDDYQNTPPYRHACINRDGSYTTWDIKARNHYWTQHGKQIDARNPLPQQPATDSELDMLLYELHNGGGTNAKEMKTQEENQVLLPSQKDEHPSRSP